MVLHGLLMNTSLDLINCTLSRLKEGSLGIVKVQKNSENFLHFQIDAKSFFDETFFYLTFYVVKIFRF